MAPEERRLGGGERLLYSKVVILYGLGIGNQSGAAGSMTDNAGCFDSNSTNDPQITGICRRLARTIQLKKRAPFGEHGFMQKEPARSPQPEAHQTVRLNIDTKDATSSV